MGFSTTLGMYNLRLFLNKLAQRLNDEGISQIPGVQIEADSYNLKGFGPQTREFVIKRKGVILLGVDALDDDGSSTYGEDELEGFSEAKAAINKEDMESSVEAIKTLLKI